MHPLKMNMRLATAAAARARGGLLSQDEEDQLKYADMLIDVSMNRNSAHCLVINQLDDNTSTLGLPMMKYYTTADHDSVVEWLYPGEQLDFSATVLCSNNESVDSQEALTGFFDKIDKGEVTDAWGVPVIINVEVERYVLKSAGPDKAFDTNDDILQPVSRY